MTAQQKPSMPDLVRDAIDRQGELISAQQAERTWMIEKLAQGQTFNAQAAASEVNRAFVQANELFWEVCRLITWAHLEMKGEEWLEWVDIHIGLARRQAYNYVAVGRALAGHDGRDKLLSLGRTKVIDIVTNLDEAEVKLLQDGDEVRGVKFDELDRMSTRDLRTRLQRREREHERLKEMVKKAEWERDRAVTKANELLHGTELDQRWIEWMEERTEEASAGIHALTRYYAQIDWPSASPRVRSQFASAYEQLRVELQELSHRVFEVAPLEAEIPSPRGGTIDLRPEAEEIWERLMMAGMGVGEVFFRDTAEMDRLADKVFEAGIADLVRCKFIEANAVAGEWVITWDETSPFKNGD